jgi:hypothetical protein
VNDAMGMLTEHVRLQGLRYVPSPIDGEPLNDYAVRCMQIGALIAVGAIHTINLASAARLTNGAEDGLRDLLATVASQNEGTPE